MAKLGRRKLPDEQRRTAASLNVRFNKQEWETVERKAADAGVSPTEWARLAAALNSALWRFRPGAEDGLRELFLSVREELHSVRMGLKGETE